MFGYPYLPTNIPGGEDPEKELPVSFVDTDFMVSLTCMGQYDRPQSIEPPLHLRQSEGGIFITVLAIYKYNTTPYVKIFLSYSG